MGLSNSAIPMLQPIFNLRIISVHRAPSSLLYAFQVVIDSATPVDDRGNASGSYPNPAEAAYGGFSGPMRAYGRMYGSLDFDDVSGSLTVDGLAYSINSIKIGGQVCPLVRLILGGSVQWGYGAVGSSKTTSRMDWRYKPY